ncbi:MAG TPA: transcriptional regulator, partial [Gammaproteobacteria bacterium]|nr:transcriptional regulator [Gammaproteobacteria bacterium]
MVDSATKVGLARFGSFEFDPESGELRGDGERIHIQEQPARILGILLQRAGHVVTREELREALWPADTFVDFDHSLNTAIRKLRAALGDSSDAPQCIETVARRGYRFLGAVEWQDAAAAEAPSRRVSARAVRIAIAAAVALAALAVSLAYLRWPAAATPSRIDSIAVLPFTVSDPAIEYLGDGL